MTKYVLDANAILSIFLDQPGFEKVENIIDNPNNDCHIHHVNACEVLAVLYRKSGDKDILDLTYNYFRDNKISLGYFHDPLNVVAVSELMQDPKLSTADCIGLQYSKSINAIFLTGDYGFKTNYYTSNYNIEFFR